MSPRATAAKTRAKSTPKTAINYRVLSLIFYQIVLNSYCQSISQLVAVMSAEKRPAAEDPGSGQMIVKRQNVGSSAGALARLNASGKSDALVQAVSS